MQNLSGLAVNSMWITSQEGGNLTHDNSGAMTAPGSAPATPMPPAVQQADPVVRPADHARTVLVPDGPRGGQPSPVPWTQADGSPWMSAADETHLPRTRIQRGEWNEV